MSSLSVTLYTIVTTFLLFGISTSSSTTATTNNNNNETTKKLNSPYKIVIDGGSTGSRLHIFEFKQDPQTSKTYIERRGSTKVNIPLSDFASPTNTNNNNTPQEPKEKYDADDDDDKAALHLLPLFQFASDIIPSEYHPTTHVSIQATAGMRLVDIDSQNALYDIIHEKLMDHDEFVFDGFRRSDIKTLDGVLEALYGVIAVNYLKGVVDVNLNYEDGNNSAGDYEEDDEDETCSYGTTTYTTPFGALDMGGASMQIVFLPSKNEKNQSICSNDSTDELKGEKLPSHEFYSTSYLSYGSDQFRERLWDLWINESEQEKNISDNKMMINNPCSFVGHETVWNGYTLYGTGDAQQCTIEINRLIPHHEEVDHEYDEYVVGGIQHPEISGEFYAMSLFFFVMDCVREYTQATDMLEEWPKPSLHELSLAVESFCSKHWVDDMQNTHGLDIHKFTKGERLSERCFESVYIIALLRDGFGFDVHSRDITYSFLVDNSEVEWSLGMAISLYADDEKNFDESTLSTSGNDNESNLETHLGEDNITDCQHGQNVEEGSGGKLHQAEDVLNQIVQNDSILVENSPI